VYSITEIPSVIESEMQQNLHNLLLTACPTDNVHDVILQVQYILFVICSYELSVKVDDSEYGYWACS